MVREVKFDKKIGATSEGPQPGHSQAPTPEGYKDLPLVPGKVYIILSNMRRSGNY